MTADEILGRYQAKEISAEIALMQLLLALGSLPALAHYLAGSETAGLVAAAHQHRAGLQRTAALIEQGLAGERRAVGAIREQFDRAVAIAPEASVALYSLGSPDVLARATGEIVARLLEWNLVGSEKRVLDIGCGIGRIETALAPHVVAITGIDVSANMVEEARRRCAGLPDVTLACCTGTDLAEFAPDSFDLVLAVDSFPYLVAAGPAIADRHIADAARILRPGGALAIFNYSYRGDLAVDRAELAASAARYSLTIERDGTQDFTLWDAAAFVLRKP